VQLQQHLIRTVRAEFEHNVSQQIYVGADVWAMIVQSREQTVAFINAVAQQLPPDSTAIDYAKLLITAYSSNGETPNDLALAALKKEAQALF
jgi:hypothetical protein